MFVPYAHWERHWYLENMRRDAASAKALLLDPQVRAECVAAYEHTLGSSQHGTTVDTWWYRQLAATWFLSVFEASGDVADRERARTELTRLGDVFVPWSSNFFWMSGKGYAELRSKLGVRG